VGELLKSRMIVFHPIALTGKNGGFLVATFLLGADFLKDKPEVDISAYIQDMATCPSPMMVAPESIYSF